MLEKSYPIYFLYSTKNLDRNQLSVKKNKIGINTVSPSIQKDLGIDTNLVEFR